jgi:Putative 2/3 transmembrane domain holin
MSANLVPPFYRFLPRLTTWLILSIILVIAIYLVSPAQLPVALYKLALISLAAVVAYWLDRALFPYARPDGYLKEDWRCELDGGCESVDYPVADGYALVFCAAMIRRAVVVLAVVVGVALGL